MHINGEIYKLTDITIKCRDIINYDEILNKLPNNIIDIFISNRPMTWNRQDNEWVYSQIIHAIKTPYKNIVYDNIITSYDIITIYNIVLNQILDYYNNNIVLRKTISKVNAEITKDDDFIYKKSIEEYMTTILAKAIQNICITSSKDLNYKIKTIGGICVYNIDDSLLGYTREIIGYIINWDNVTNNIPISLIEKLSIHPPFTWMQGLKAWGEVVISCILSKSFNQLKNDAGDNFKNISTYDMITIYNIVLKELLNYYEDNEFMQKIIDMINAEITKDDDFIYKKSIKECMTIILAMAIQNICNKELCCKNVLN